MFRVIKPIILLQEIVMTKSFQIFMVFNENYFKFNEVIKL